jgi:hypothetical protein
MQRANFQQLQFPRAILSGRRITAGNTLMEFSAIGTLVMMASLGVLFSLGDNLNGWFGGLKGNMQMQVSSVETARLAQASERSYFKATEANRQQAIYSMQAVSLPVVDHSAATQTVGSNGTRELASQLEILARQGLDAGTLTQPQYDMLMRMANAGHDIARVEEMLVDARQRSEGDTVVYNSVRYNYEGRSLSAPDLANMAGEKVSSFTTLRQNAEQLGLFTDQTIGTQIESASMAILTNGSSAHTIGRDATKAVETVSVQETGQDTHEQSGVICTSGSYQDDGTQCTN